MCIAIDEVESNIEKEHRMFTTITKHTKIMKTEKQNRFLFATYSQKQLICTTAVQMRKYLLACSVCIA